MSAEMLGSKPDSVVRTVSQIHTAYRGAEELRKAQEAFAARIKRKRLKKQTPKQIELSLQRFLSKAFPEKEGYRIQLNWDESEGAEKDVLNSQNPFFLTKDKDLSTEEIAGRNVLQEGWGMWTHYSYDEWYEWYIHKPGGIPIGNPFALTLFPLVLPLVYHIPRAFIEIKNKIMNKYDDGDLVKLENFLEDNTTPLSEMQNTEAELHFMRTFLVHDYHEKRINKFVDKLSHNLYDHMPERLAESSDDEPKSQATQLQIQNYPSMTSHQKIAVLTNSDTNILVEHEEVQSHLKKYKISTRGMIMGGVTAFLAGFFAWPVSIFANTHVAGAVGLTAASAVTGIFVVIGLVAGAIYVYNNYKESKRVNKKIDALDEDLLLEQQQKISSKIEQVNANITEIKVKLGKVQKKLSEENKKPNIIAYKGALAEKNQYIQNKHNREELEQLRDEIKDLGKHKEQLTKLMEEKEQDLDKMLKEQTELNSVLKNEPEEKNHNALKELNLSIAELQKEIGLLPNKIQDTEMLITQKTKRQENLPNTNDGKHNDSELLDINKKLAELEKTDEVKSYNEMIKEEAEIKKEQADVFAKLEKLHDKGRKSQERHHHYQEICKKVQKEKELRHELAQLNKTYEEIVNNYANQAKPERREEIKQTFLSEEMIDPKLESVEYLLRYKQVEKTSIATVSALVNVKRSIVGPHKEDTPPSVGAAFKGLGKAMLDDIWSVGTKIYDYYSAASVPICVANIALLGVAIAGLAASPLLLVGAAVAGVVFTANHFYEEHKKSENAVRDAFLDDPEFSKYTVDEHISCLEEAIEHCKLRNEKTTQLLQAELNKDKSQWLEKAPPASESLLTAGIFMPRKDAPQPQLQLQIPDVMPPSPPPRPSLESSLG